jgi:hypothetical protein
MGVQKVVVMRDGRVVWSEDFGAMGVARGLSMDVGGWRQEVRQGGLRLVARRLDVLLYIAGREWRCSMTVSLS